MHSRSSPSVLVSRWEKEGARGNWIFGGIFGARCFAALDVIYSPLWTRNTYGFVMDIVPVWSFSWHCDDDGGV
jgi:hypothetical protein